MPRMTEKYRKAILKADDIGTRGNAPIEDQEWLYDHLYKSGWYWDSKVKRWEYHSIAKAEAPTPQVLIRVWADLSHVENTAKWVVRSLKPELHLVEQSKVYPCRPPKQREGRVYLRFERIDRHV